MLTPLEAIVGICLATLCPLLVARFRLPVWPLIVAIHLFCSIPLGAAQFLVEVVGGFGLFFGVDLAMTCSRQALRTLHLFSYAGYFNGGFQLEPTPFGGHRPVVRCDATGANFGEDVMAFSFGIKSIGCAMGTKPTNACSTVKVQRPRNYTTHYERTLDATNQRNGLR